MTKKRTTANETPFEDENPDDELDLSEVENDMLAHFSQPVAETKIDKDLEELNILEQLEEDTKNWLSGEYEAINPYPPKPEDLISGIYDDEMSAFDDDDEFPDETPASVMDALAEIFPLCLNNPVDLANDDRLNLAIKQSVITEQFEKLILNFNDVVSTIRTQTPTNTQEMDDLNVLFLGVCDYLGDVFIELSKAKTGRFMLEHPQ